MCVRFELRVDWGVSELATLTVAGGEAAGKVNMPQDFILSSTKGVEPLLASLQTFRIRADVQWVRKSS